MKKLLIIGGTGLLGNQLILDLKKDFDITATYHRNKINNKLSAKTIFLDITNDASVKKVIQSDRYDLVLHCASVGDVDYCEKNKKEAWKINVLTTKHIADACFKQKTRLVYFSTNAIYDGVKGNYDENSITEPINYYGITKLAGENVVKKSGVSYLILRLNTMFGWNTLGQRENPAVWIIKNLKNGENIKVVHDVYNNHLWVGFVSKIIRKVSKKWPNNEVFNIAGSECINRHEFALKVAKIFKLNPKLINKAKSTDFLFLAPRPKDTCFKTNKMVRTFKIKPLSVNEGLKLMFQQGRRYKIY